MPRRKAGHFCICGQRWAGGRRQPNCNSVSTNWAPTRPRCRQALNAHRSSAPTREPARVQHWGPPRVPPWRAPRIAGRVAQRAVRAGRQRGVRARGALCAVFTTQTRPRPIWHCTRAEDALRCACAPLLSGVSPRTTRGLYPRAVSACCAVRLQERPLNGLEAAPGGAHAAPDKPAAVVARPAPTATAGDWPYSGVGPPSTRPKSSASASPS